MAQEADHCNNCTETSNEPPRDENSNTTPVLSVHNAENTDTKVSTNKKEDARHQTSLSALLEQMKPFEAPRSGSKRKEDVTVRKDWRFWNTQPVLQLGETSLTSEPINPNQNPDEIRKEPYNLPSEFCWKDINVLNDTELKELYVLLNENYVEDDDNMFRFDYSQPFLKWALCPPGWNSAWHVGVRVKKNNVLVGFISAVPATIKIYDNIITAVEINFLCVHKKLRSKRMAPVLIKEITRRVNLNGIFQAVYTAGVLLPGVVAKCRYWHRSLNVRKLLDVHFSYLSKMLTVQRYEKLHRLPTAVATNGFRPMEEKDFEQAHNLLTEYLKRFSLAPVFTLKEFVHQFSNRENVVNSYVVENKDGKITDFASFYHLSSTVMHHPQHKTLKAAYSFYNVANVTPLVQLMRDCLIVAKEQGFDVFNALDLMDNRPIFEELKFGIGDGNLHYYLYNWRAMSMEPSDVGLVLL